MNLTMETLEARRSIRSFSGYPLTSSDRALIEDAIRGAGPCPFGTTPRFVLVEPHEAGGQASGRIGTYGVIKGVRLQESDIDIAMRHFEVAARAGNLPGSWTGLDEVPVQFGHPMIYHSSWVVR
jgi:hypothetical protein